MSAGPAEAVRGDWDGIEAIDLVTARAELAELQRQVRGAYLDVIQHRDRWAHGTTAEDRCRAVAYQTCASRLLRILDTQRRPAAPIEGTESLPWPRAIEHAAPPETDNERKPLGWLFRQKGRR